MSIDQYVSQKKYLCALKQILEVNSGDHLPKLLEEKISALKLSVRRDAFSLGSSKAFELSAQAAEMEALDSILELIFPNN